MSNTVSEQEHYAEIEKCLSAVLHTYYTTLLQLIPNVSRIKTD